MLRTLRSPLALLAGCGSGVPCDASIAAAERLAKETSACGGLDGAKLAAASEATPRPMVTGSLSYRRDNHLPSKAWYLYEYSERKPKLLERVKPAYVLEYEQ